MNNIKLKHYEIQQSKLVTNTFEPIQNHEIWHKCELCGAEYDLRKTDKCDECKKTNGMNV